MFRSRLRMPAALAQAITKILTGRRGRQTRKKTKTDYGMRPETEAWQGLMQRTKATTSFLRLKDDQQEGRQ